MPSSQKVAHPPDPSRAAAGGLLFFWRLLLVMLLVRGAYAAMLQLVPDEAFYWTWTRHLALGYLDHPPMIAWLTWIGTHVAGNTELGVRVVGVLLSIATTIAIVLVGRRLLRDERATFWLAVIWLTSPLLTLSGIIATPDMPAIFFSVCGLTCVTLIADRVDQAKPGASPGLWLLFGVFSGLALLSKYPAVLLPTATALAFLFSHRGRAHYRRPWIYLSGIVALTVFSPVIYWNAHHQWASFLFQLRHGTADYEATAAPLSFGMAVAQFFKDIGLYIGGQIGVWTPILFVIALLVLAEGWARYRRIRDVDRLLLWMGTVPLVFFGVACVRAHHTEVNWPTFAYFPISILSCRWFVAGGSEQRRNWVKGGCQLACGILVALLIIGLPPVTAKILQLPYRVPHMLRDLTGHRDDGRVMGQWTRQWPAPVVTNHHQDAGELAFYMPGQPDVWCVGVGARPTAFDYFDDPPAFARIPRVWWVGGHVDLFCRKYGFTLFEHSSAMFPNAGRPRYFGADLLERPPVAPEPH